MESSRHAWATMQESRRDRRRDARMPAPPELSCTIAGFPAGIRVRNISSGGLAVYVPAPLKTRVEHDVTLTFNALTITCRVRVAYCFNLDRGRWLAGLTLLESNVGATFDPLMDAIQS